MKINLYLIIPFLFCSILQGMLRTPQIGRSFVKIQAEKNPDSNLDFPINLIKVSETLNQLISTKGIELGPIAIPGTTKEDILLLKEFLSSIFNNPTIKNKIEIKNKSDLDTYLAFSNTLKQRGKITNIDSMIKWLNLADYLNIPQLIHTFKVMIANNITPQQWTEKQDKIVQNLKPNIDKYHWALKKQDLPGFEGFSIQELLDFGLIDKEIAIPKGTRHYKLELSNLAIKDLNGLDTFTRGLTFESVNLSHNKIKSIKNWWSIPLALMMDLSYNELTELPEQGFLHSQVHEINLSHNKLSNLKDTTFDRIGGLRVLDLSNNQLKDLPANIFSSHKFLTHLNLSNNHLKNLPDNIFSGLNNLRMLDLSNNPLPLKTRLYYRTFYWSK